MTEQQHKEYYAVLTECWRFFLKYGKLGLMTDALWQQCISEGTEIVRKYGCSRFSKDLMLAMENEIERMQGGKHGNKTG